MTGLLQNAAPFAGQRINRAKPPKRPLAAEVAAPRCERYERLFAWQAMVMPARRKVRAT